jgi:uncharacterized spore protein YtfJ
MAENLQSMFERLSQSASVSSVYGEAISAHGKTIIPVARISYGFGSGSGRRQSESTPGEGEGGGGGLYAMPLGVLEITDTETRFIAMSDKRKLAGAALAGFCLGAFWSRCRR